MSILSPTDAAFEGFRLSREQPRTLFVWALLLMLLDAAAGYVMIAAGWGAEVAQFEARAEAAGSDPTIALNGLAALGPMYAVLLAAGLLIGSIFTCGVYRAVLNPEDRGFGHLRLGGDEVRQILVVLSIFLLAIGSTFVVVLVAGLLSALISHLIGPMAVLAGLALALFAVGILVFIAVRLSLAGPQTFAEKRLVVFGSWYLTRGNFWRLLGTYLLAAVTTIVVLLMGVIIFVAAAAITTGGDMAATGSIFKPDFSSLSAFFTPARLIYLPFGALFAAVQYALLLAPAAAAYRSLATRDDGLITT